MIGDFIFQIIEGTKNVDRWQGKTVVRRNNISEHMHGVSFIAYMLCLLEIEEYGNKVDVEKVVTRSIVHDCPEILTTDLPSGMKRKARIMERAIGIVENKYYDEEIGALLPKKYADKFKSMFLDPKEGKETIEGKIIDFADNLYALLECVMEIHCGNYRFKKYLQQVINALIKTELKSGRYLLKYAIPNFGLDLELYGSNYLEYLKNETIEDIEHK